MIPLLPIHPCLKGDEHPFKAPLNTLRTLWPTSQDFSPVQEQKSDWFVSQAQGFILPTWTVQGE